MYDYTKIFKILILFTLFILYSFIVPFISNLRLEKYYINQGITYFLFSMDRNKNYYKIFSFCSITLF